MNPLHLSEDELVYELSIRKINLNDVNRIDQLIQRINNEVSGLIETPTDIARITRQTIPQELRKCEHKVQDIFNFITTAVQEADDQLAERGQTRLLHIKQRLDRLLLAAPDEDAVRLLRARVTDMQVDTIIARDSLAGGREQLAEPEEGAQALEVLQQEPVRSPIAPRQIARGAIPKTVTVQHQPSSTAAQAMISNRFEWREPQRPRLSSSNNSAPTRSMGSLADLFENRSPTRNAVPNPNVQHLFDHAIIDARLNASQNHNLNPDAPRYIPPNVYQPQIQRFQPAPSPPTVQRPRLSNQHLGARQVVANGQHIHQWNLRFDGTPGGLDVEDFIYRVEQQAELYGVTHQALRIGVVHLLSGIAEMWYWTNQRNAPGGNWATFKEALIRRYAPHRPTNFEIRSKVENRQQQPNESFNEYCQHVEFMAARMTRRIPEDELVEILRRNMSVSLRKALWQRPTATIDELLQITFDFERMCREEDTRARQRRPTPISEINFDDYNVIHERNSAINTAPHVNEIKHSSRNRNEFAICWNCDDIGHFHSNCPRPQMAFFCYGCGEKNVIAVHCTKCSGNARRGPSMTETVHRTLQNRPPPPPTVQQPTTNYFSKEMRPNRPLN